MTLNVGNANQVAMLAAVTDAGDSAAVPVHPTTAVSRPVGCSKHTSDTVDVKVSFDGGTTYFTAYQFAAGVTNAVYWLNCFGVVLVKVTKTGANGAATVHFVK